jgi:hypothetical protein
VLRDIKIYENGNNFLKGYDQGPPPGYNQGQPAGGYQGQPTGGYQGQPTGGYQGQPGYGQPPATVVLLRLYYIIHVYKNFCCQINESMYFLKIYIFFNVNTHGIYEPRHDKTNIMGLRPAWIQTSLRIRAV